MKITRLPVIVSLDLPTCADPNAYVRSEVFVPEGPEGANWLKLKSVLSYDAPVRLLPGEDAPTTPGAHLELARRQLVQEHAEIIELAISHAEQAGFVDPGDEL